MNELTAAEQWFVWSLFFIGFLCVLGIAAALEGVISRLLARRHERYTRTAAGGYQPVVPMSVRKVKPPRAD